MGIEQEQVRRASPDSNGYKEHLPPRIVLSAENVTFSYGDKDAVRNISLDIPENQITAIIGPSGCGKSTLLRAFNRMNDLIPGARLKEGTIRFRGQDLYYGKNIDPPKVRQNIGIVAQKPNLLVGDILYNMMYGYDILGIRDKKLKEAVAEDCLRKAYLWDEVKDRLKNNPNGLSGGQQQRLCIARALATPAKTVLMDEPCSSLDPIATQAIEELMLELKKTHTIVIVTHNLQQARRVSDYTAFLNVRQGPQVKGRDNMWGELVEYAPTEQLFSDPQHPETQRYIRGDFG